MNQLIIAALGLGSSSAGKGQKPPHRASNCLQASNKYQGSCLPLQRQLLSKHRMMLITSSTKALHRLLQGLTLTRRNLARLQWLRPGPKHW